MKLVARPYIVVAKVRACDLRVGDIVYFTEHDLWLPLVLVDVDGTFVYLQVDLPAAPMEESTRRESRWELLDLLDVQVETVGGNAVEDDSPPVPIVADPAYMDSLRGGKP